MWWMDEAGYNMSYPLAWLNVSVSSKPAPATSFSNISFYTAHLTVEKGGPYDQKVTMMEKLIDCRLDLVAHKYNNVNTTSGVLNLGTPDVLPLKDTERDTHYSLEVVDPSLVPANITATFNVSDYLRFSSGELLYNFVQPGLAAFLDLAPDLTPPSPIQQKITTVISKT